MKILILNIHNRLPQRKVVYILFFTLLFLPHIIFAQYENLEFENFTRDDGLTVSDVSSIVQGRDGFIWIGTWYAVLLRYDGYNFKPYKIVQNTDETIDGIKILYEDRNGILWIGTYIIGLIKFDKNTEQFTYYKHNPDDPTSISSNDITSIYMDREGFLWVGTPAGLNKFDEKNNKFIHYTYNPNDTNSIISMRVRAICEDHLKNLWVGTTRGLDRLERNTGVFHHYEYNPSDKSSLSSNRLNCIFEDNNKTLWIGTAEGLNKLICLSEDDYCFQRYFFDDTIKNKSNISWIHQDNAGILWIGTFGEGLFIFDPVTEKFANFKNNVNNDKSLTGDRISRYSIIEDRSGILWIGTKHGISKYNKNKSNFNIYPFKEPVHGWSTFEDNTGNIWITGKENFHVRDSSGIFKIIPFKVPHKRIMDRGYVITSYLDKAGVIWLGYESFLYNYDRTKGELKYFCDLRDKNFGRACIIDIITEDSENILWVGTWDGLFSIDKERNNISRYYPDADDPYNINSSIVRCILEDENGAIWISFYSHGGMNKFDKKTRRFYHYTHDSLNSNSICCNVVYSLYGDGRGNLWIGTLEGLDKLNLATDTFEHFTDKDGIANRFNLCILPDNSGNLWIATNNGISKFNPNTQKFKNYDKRDGLQGVEFYTNGFRSSSGELFFFGVNGINHFFPDSIKENNNIPAVVITSFKVFGKEAKLDKPTTKTEEITLSYKENFFSFEFSALEYTNPAKNQYSYKLEGVDKDWINSGNIRTSNYTNIDPGEYVFRVKGSNNDGVWNEDGTSIRIIITPPWWQTWWFRGCVIISLAGFTGLAFNRRLQLVKKEKIVQEEITRQLISAHEEERKRIAGELHDSLGQNLLIIKNKTILGMKNPEKNPAIVDEISELTSSTLQEVREISYNLHPYQLERLGLTKAIESITERALKSTNIEFKDKIEIIDNFFCPDAEINIFRIIQECVNNIIKHSGASKAQLVIKREQDNIKITISDNGKGFNVNSVLSDKSKRGIGLMNMYERAKLFNGKVAIESAPGNGTKCDITIPLTKI